MWLILEIIITTCGRSSQEIKQPVKSLKIEIKKKKWNKLAVKMRFNSQQLTDNKWWENIRCVHKWTPSKIEVNTRNMRWNGEQSTNAFITRAKIHTQYSNVHGSFNLLKNNWLANSVQCKKINKWLRDINLPVCSSAKLRKEWNTRRQTKPNYITDKFMHFIWRRL